MVYNLAMGSQFIHIESYGREAGKGKNAGNNITAIIAEAEREDGACYHVEDPKPPVVLYGSSFREAGEEAKKWAETMTDARGHKLRKDALCMVAGVVSAPDDLENWDKYKKDTVKWLKAKYGKSLRSVIEHTDEPHSHIHFAVVAEKGKRFETIHQGYAAQKEADPKRGDRKRSAEEKAQGRRQGIHAFQNAMRDYQDSFYTMVSKKHGLTRIGPGRRRLTRGEWKQEQANARQIANSMSFIDDQNTMLMAVSRKLRNRENAVSEAEQKPEMKNELFLKKHFKGLSPDEVQACWGALVEKAQIIKTERKANKANTKESSKSKAF